MHAMIYARANGTLAHVFTSDRNLTPDAETTQIARIPLPEYQTEYAYIANNSKAITFDGANLVEGGSALHDSAWIAARGAEVDAVAQAVIVEADSDSQAAAIPNWSTWDEATALAWHDTNIAANIPVASLAEANAVLADMETENRALIRMVIAMRNKLWPSLQE